MMQRAWYAFVKVWMRLAIKLFYRRIEIRGLNDFPLKGPVLLAPNHQNGFMDALLPAVFAPRDIHYLVRADVFKSWIARKFFGSFNMMPVYRGRDGMSNLAKNEEIFRKCFDILRRGEVLLLFPEATHLGERRLRPLSKGFTRIVFGALQGHEDMELTIIPLGLNYSNYQQSQSRLLMNFGTPIRANDFLGEYAENPQAAMRHLRETVSQKLLEEIIHLEDPDDQKVFEVEIERILPFYLDRTSGYTEKYGHHDFYKKREEAIRLLDRDHPHFRRLDAYDKAMEKLRLRAPLFFLSGKDPGYWAVQTLFLIAMLPLFILSWTLHAPYYFLIKGFLKKFVRDRQFYSSIKVVGAFALFPIFGILIACAVGYWVGRPLWVVLGAAIFLPLSVFLIRELRLHYRYAASMWRSLFLKWRNRDLYAYLRGIEDQTIAMYERMSDTNSR